MEKSLFFHLNYYLVLLESSGNNNLNNFFPGSLFCIEAIELISEK